MSEDEFTVLGEKGQVVIPQKVRNRLGLEPRTRFRVFAEGDTIVLRRLKLPSLDEEWASVFRDLGPRGRQIGPAAVAREVAAHRKRQASP